jgi:hypothetical protein
MTPAWQTREDFEKKRWDPDVRCEGQVEPGVRDAVWTEIMKWDKAPPEGESRRVSGGGRRDEPLG